MEDVTNKQHPSQSDVSADGFAIKGLHLSARDTTATALPSDEDLHGVPADAITTSDESPSLDSLSITDSELVRHELPNIMTTHPVVHEYLLKHCTEYEQLDTLRRKGWGSEKGDRHFENQRYKADHANKELRNVFYHMMCEIATDFDNLTGVISRLREVGNNPKALDLCMAPGGFAGAVLRAIRNAIVCGITLPVEDGGHPMTMPLWETNQRLQTLWLDITMLAAEMGADKIPPEHPEASKFSTLRPFGGQAFDLVFCDGNVLRTQKRETYRERKERVRLLTSQLILAMQRIKAGGSLIIRFHKLEAVDTATILCSFTKFSSIQLFKPPKHHAIRSSFYMIAKDVQPQHPEAIRALKGWKKQWVEMTMDTEESDPNAHLDDQVENEKAEALLATFGPELITLGRPIWGIQANALSKSHFIREGVNASPNHPQSFSSQVSHRTLDGLFTPKPSTRNPWLAGDPRRDPLSLSKLNKSSQRAIQEVVSDGVHSVYIGSGCNKGLRVPSPTGDSSQSVSRDETSSGASLVGRLTGSPQGKKPGSLLELARQKARPSHAASRHVWRPENNAAIPIRSPSGDLIDPKEFAAITPPKKQAVSLKDADGNEVDLASLKAKSPSPPSAPIG